MAKKAKRNDFDPSLFQGIAHRGLHTAEYTENGLNAFRNALENGVAMELDIHLSKDGVLIVCHDSNLVRTTGKEGIIEDLTSEEIRENYRLLDGGVVPTYQEVLDLVGERLPIVTELKTYHKNHRALAKATREILKQIKDKKKITLISFDPRALLFFGKRGFTRGLLICEEHEWVKRFIPFFEYIDIQENLAARPTYVAYRKKGGLVNVWTVDSKEKAEHVKGNADMITYQLIDRAIIDDLCK